MFKQIRVPLDNLMLDPNNPRCVTSAEMRALVLDQDVAAHQDRLLGMFDSSGQSEFFSIRDLLDSFRQVGFIPIDKIVVRRLTTNDFLVIEGNRRVSALKYLQRAQQRAKEDLSSDLLNVMANVPVLELEAHDIPSSELNRRVAILLGLRHHGSLLEWEPLPKAFNIFKTYMAIHPAMAEFSLQASRRQSVAGILAVPSRDVTRALKTYIAFRQLRDEIDGVRDSHYSLIEASVTERRLDGFLNIDSSTFRLDPTSVGRLDQVCQFAVRDRMDAEQKVLPKPQSVALLGRLLEMSQTATNDVVRAVAQRNLNDVIAAEVNPDTGNLKIDLESAVNGVIDLERRTEWKSELERLLVIADENLVVSDFRGIGNDQLQLEKASRALRPLQLALSVQA